MPIFLPMVVTFVLFAAVGLGVIVLVRRQRAQFLREAATFADVRASQRSFGVLSLETVPPLPRASIVATGGGKNNPARWDATSLSPRLAERTSLTIDEEGLLGKLREKLGGSDIKIGDEGFDRRFCIRGSDSDVVRGVVQHPAVQQAIRTFFNDPLACLVKVKEDGTFSGRFLRSTSTASAGRDKLLLVAALVAALEENADAEIVRPQGSSVESAGVGGASGSPVGVSLGTLR